MKPRIHYLYASNSPPHPLEFASIYYKEGMVCELEPPYYMLEKL
jgi:hypothetical protein